MGSLKHPIALRTAQAGDAESIAVLHTDSWRRTYRGMMTDAFLDGGALANRRRVWRERLNATDPNQFVCVAQHASGIVGFICAFANHDPVWGSYIDNLHVSQGLHRSGIGTTLMRSVGEWLVRVHPQQGVYLWVMEANASAREFYDRLGAMNAETADKEDPGGGRAPNCRYVWARPHLLSMPQ